MARILRVIHVWEACRSVWCRNFVMLRKASHAPDLTALARTVGNDPVREIEVRHAGPGQRLRPQPLRRVGRDLAAVLDRLADDLGRERGRGVLVAVPLSRGPRATIGLEHRDAGHRADALTATERPGQARVPE